jgi:hypothetical protein
VPEDAVPPNLVRLPTSVTGKSINVGGDLIARGHQQYFTIIRAKRGQEPPSGYGLYCPTIRA